jgi:sulfite exporter TauE/SafE
MIAEAFFLGLMGSLHCLGMCGGFSIAFHRRGPKGLAAYQGGRAIGYVAGGTLCGTLGGGLAFTIGNPGLQAVVGLVFIAFGLGWSPKWNSGGRLLTALAPLIKKPGLSSAAAMGLLTALLPCGLLAAAWMKAAESGSPAAGAASMFFFWLGTLPLQLLIGFVPQWLRPSPKLAHLVSASLVCLGLLTLIKALLLPPSVSPHGCQL